MPSALSARCVGSSYCCCCQPQRCQDLQEKDDRKNNRVAVRSVGCLETERTSWLSSSNISDASKQQPGVLQWHQDLDQHWEPQRVQVLCMRMMVSPSGEGKYFSGGISHHLATGGANTASISNAKHKSVKGK
ncbi:hypothetical protein AV530_019471 [Patagioenas fasciata monilis]|uniref:Uncharacterized protein n=1 Tax=Patagioenas fasciata monilis TaxID=372326 RepID=A0A1V4JDN4_PATFA|nr:hypothetical protein AV530_019471 [Patagioenas fasciata monilis]